MSNFLKKAESGSPYNFELKELIDGFSFYNFTHDIKVNNDYDNYDHGAMVVFTDNQYVASYNKGFGAGSHMGLGARIYRDIEGGGIIRDDKEAMDLFAKCNKEYLTCRIVYDVVGRNRIGIPIYSGIVHFDFKYFSPSVGQIEVFKKFIEDFNEDFMYVCNKIGSDRFYISVTLHDDDDTLFNDNEIIGERKSKTLRGRTSRTIYCTDFNTVLKYLEKIVDVNKKYKEDHTIIGVALNNKRL